MRVGMLIGKAIKVIVNYAMIMLMTFMTGCSNHSSRTKKLSMAKRCNKKKGYIILGYNESEDKYYGYIELSFSMGASDKDVQVYSTSKDACWDRYFQEKYIDLFKKMNPNSPNQLIYYWLRDISIGLNKKRYNNCTWRVYRINSKSCPVIVDMKYVKLIKNSKEPWNRGKKIKYSKYMYRNQPFIRK